MNIKNFLVTGGAGFIGSSFASMQVAQGHNVIVLDALTYAGKKGNLSWIDGKNYPGKYQLIVDNILNTNLVLELLQKHNIDYLVHFAAESHVDNSIKNPNIFVETNVNGTNSLLQASLKFWKEKTNFHFHHISTDEVFGDLPLDTPERFTENTPYSPSSPYSASKAASDHLVRAYHRTYGLPITISNCSNNFGPRQDGEKLIPTIIRKALNDENIPIYGDGKNVRDWIYVDDHNRGVELILQKGQKGETYCLGGNAERNNNQIVNLICEILDKYQPRADKKSYKSQITYVKDRAGHDRRYAIDGTKIEKELGFKIAKTFEENLENYIASLIK